MSVRLSRHDLVSFDSDNSFYQDMEKANVYSGFDIWGKIVRYISNLIFDNYLHVNEYIELFDWENKGSEVGYFFGSTLTLLFFTTRFIQYNILEPNKEKIESSKDYFDFSQSKTLREYVYFSDILGEKYKRSNGVSSSRFEKYLGSVNSVVQGTYYLLLLANISLAVQFLFFSYKDYLLFFTKHPPKSKNIVVKSFDDIPTDNCAQKRYIVYLKRLWAHLMNNKLDTLKTTSRVYYKFYIWSPSSTVASIFASFSPIVCLYLFFNEPRGGSLIAVFLLNTLMRYLILDCFMDNRKDMNILSAALIEESTKKITSSYVTQSRQPGEQDRKLFITHSFSGETIKEAYNYEKQEFEII